MSLNTKPLQLNKITVVFAALTFAQLDALKPEVDLLMSGAGANPLNADARDAVVKVSLASLQEANPEVTEEDLRNNIDAFNFASVINAIFSRNSFINNDPAGDESGEAKAAPSVS